MFNKKNKFYYKLLFPLFSISLFTPVFIVSCNSKKNDNSTNDNNINNNLIGDEELKHLIIDGKLKVILNQNINISLNYFNTYKSNKTEIIKMFMLKFDDDIEYQSSFKLEIEQEPTFNEKDNNTINCKFRITNLKNSKYIIYDARLSYFNFSSDETYFKEVYENISRSLYLKKEFENTRIIDLFEEKSTILNQDFIDSYIDKERSLTNVIGIDYQLDIPSQNLKMNQSNYFQFKLSLFDQKTQNKIVLNNISITPSLNVKIDQKDTFTILNQEDLNQTPTSLLNSNHLGKIFIRPKTKVVEEIVEINLQLQGKVIINELDLSYFKNLVFGHSCDFKRNNITNVIFSSDSKVTNLNNEIFKYNSIKEINLPNHVINYSRNCFDKNVVVNTKINSINSLDKLLVFDDNFSNPNLRLDYLDSENQLEEFLNFISQSKLSRTILKFNKVYLPIKFTYSNSLLNNYLINCSEVILPNDETINEFKNTFSNWIVEKVIIPSSIIKINKNIFPQSTVVTREFNKEVLNLIKNNELHLHSLQNIFSFNLLSDIDKLDDYFFSFNNTNYLDIQKIIFSENIIQNYSYSLDSNWKFFFENNSILDKKIVFNETVEQINIDFYNSLKSKDVTIERQIYSKLKDNVISLTNKTLYLKKFYDINSNVKNFKNYLSGYENYIENIDASGIAKIKESTFDSLENWEKININLEQIQEIEYRAFYRCSLSIKEIKLDNLTSIGDYAFYGCNQIEELNLINLTSIGNYAFYGCKQLIKITIPKITSLNSYVFYNCENLKEIKLDNLTSIGDYAFYGCNQIEELNLINLTSIGNYAFSRCTQIKKIISKDLSNVGNYAFYDCNNLVNLQINNKTISGTNSFHGCKKLDLSFNIDLTSFDIELHFGLNSQNYPDKFKEIKIDNSKIDFDEKNKILDLSLFDWNDLSAKNTLLLFSQKMKSSSNKLLEEVILPRKEIINSKFKYIFSNLTINKLIWNTNNIKNFNETLSYYFNSTIINSIDENFCVGMESIPNYAFSNQLKNQKKISLQNVKNIGNYSFSTIDAEFINTSSIQKIGKKSFSSKCKFQITTNVQLEDDSFTTNWKDLDNKDIVREQIFSNSNKFGEIYNQKTKTLDFTKIKLNEPSDYQNLTKYENISLYLLDGDVELLILPKIYNLTPNLYSNLGTINSIKFQNENQVIFSNAFNNTKILNKPSINETRILFDEDNFFH